MTWRAIGFVSMDKRQLLLSVDAGGNCQLTNASNVVENDIDLVYA